MDRSQVIADGVAIVHQDNRATGSELDDTGLDAAGVWGQAPEHAAKEPRATEFWSKFLPLEQHLGRGGHGRDCGLFHGPWTGRFWAKPMKSGALDQIR